MSLFVAGSRGLLAAAATDTQWRPLHPLPAWLLFLILLGLGVVFLVLYLREQSPVGVIGRSVLALLRLGAAAALLSVLVAPACERVRREPVDSWVLLLLDQSVSMSLQDRYADEGQVRGLAKATGLAEAEVEATARLDLVKRALERDQAAFLRALAAKNRIKVYGFGQARRLAPLAEIDRLDPAGASPEAEQSLAAALAAIRALEPADVETAVGDSLSLALGDSRARRIAGVVLLTDGRSNADLTPPVKAAESTRGVPVYAVGIGNPEEPRDIAVSDLQAAEVVIAGDRLRLKVSVQSQGFVGDERFVELEVALDGAVVATEAVELLGGGARQDVTAQIRTEEPGEYTLTVGIKPRPGELIIDNNQPPAQRLRVIDKRIKVLLVDDLPRWEFRRLKWLLVRDENMEAQTFQISADPTVRQDASPGLEPLTELPKTREEMFQYHVVVLGDVNPAAPELEGRLELIREFVDEGGGGLLLVAGRRFMPRAYADTPLEALLPVEIDRDDLGDIGVLQPITSAFKPQLTLDGRGHPIMQLENEAELNLQTWSALPGFFWYYRALSAKPTATVLATHPSTTTAKDQPMPIVSIQQSAGSTMLVSSDETWRWRAGVEDRYTQRFWGQAVRYLSTGRLMRSKRFHVTTDKAIYDRGERVSIRAEVNDQALQPSEEETQVVYLEGPGGETKRVTLTRPPNKKGQYTGQETVTRVGAYRVFLAAQGPEPGTPGEELAVRPFHVQVPVLEKLDPKMDQRTLTRMAEASGGAFTTLADAAGLPERVGAVDDPPNEIIEDAVLVLMRWESIVAVVVLLAFEWLLRKKWKMW